MFLTHQPFKHHIQIEKNVTLWDAVELAINVPLYLVTALDLNQECERDFLYSSDHEVLKIILDKSHGKLIALHLLQPPAWSESKKWNLIAVRQVFKGKHRSMIMMGADGVVCTSPSSSGDQENLTEDMELLINLD